MAPPFSWRDEHMRPFLEAYKRYECLWNNKSENYHKSYIRENAFKGILKELNIPGVTVHDLKLKIKTIRTRYASELAKIKKSDKPGIPPEEKYFPRLFWFRDADSFLRDVCSQKYGIPVVNYNKDKSTEKPEINEESRSVDLENQASESTLDETIQDPITREAYSPTVERTAVKRRLPNGDESIPGSIKKLKQIFNTGRSHESEQNEFDVFCNSLAIQLKKMPLRQALICQEKLQATMTKQRLLHLDEEESSRKVEVYRFETSPANSFDDTSLQEFCVDTSENCDSKYDVDTKPFIDFDDG